MNKRIILSVFALLVSSTAGFSQFLSQGTLIGGGSAGFSSNTSKSDPSNSKTTQSTFSLSPSVQYFVVDNFGIGAMLSTSTSTKKIGAAKYTENSFLLGPIARYYFTDQGFFGEAFLIYGPSTDGSFSGSTAKYRNVSTGAGVGYSIRVNNFILLDPMAGYRYTNAKDKNSNVRTRDGELYLSLGFTMILAK